MALPLRVRRTFGSIVKSIEFGISTGSVISVIHGQSHWSHCPGCGRLLTTAALLQKQNRKLKAPKPEQSQELEARKAKRHLPFNRLPVHSTRLSEYEAVLKFRYAALNGDVKVVLREYPLLMRDGHLRGEDTHLIAKTLHLASLRNGPVPEDQIHVGMEEFVKFYRAGALQSHSRAILHILAYYRDTLQTETGIRFWNWVIKRHREVVGVASYGIAIQLLAREGSGLEACEELFILALKENSYQFDEYLFSNGSVVSQPKSRSPGKTVSLNLLRGIIEARLIYGDWRGAYLGLDTALKLRPGPFPVPIFDLFLRHRTTEECLVVFKILARSGTRIPAGRTLQLVLQMSNFIPGDGIPYHESLTELLSLIEFFKAAEMDLNSSHLDIFLRVVLRLVPELGDSGHPLADEAKQAFRNLIAVTLELFECFSVSANSNVIKTIIIKAVKIGDVTVFREQVVRILETDFVADIRFLESCLENAGEIGNEQDVMSVWDAFRQRRADLTSTTKAWEILAKVFSPMEDQSMFISAIANEETINEGATIARLLEISTGALGNTKKGELTSYTPTMATESVPAKVKEQGIDQLRRLETFIESVRILVPELKQDREQFYDVLNRWLIKTGYPPQWYETLYHDMHIKPLDSRANLDSLGDNETTGETREQGDRAAPSESETSLETELSQEPGDLEAQPSPENAEPIFATDPMTGLGFDEVRFQNWRDITDLLLRVKAFSDRCDLDQRKIPRWFENTREGKRRESLTQHELFKQGLWAQRTRLTNEEAWRQEVLALRQTELVSV